MKRVTQKEIDNFPFKLLAEYAVFDEFTTAGWADITDYPLNNPDFPLRLLPYDRLRPEMLKLGICNGFRVLVDPTDEKVAECDPARNFVLIDLFRPNWDWKRPQYPAKFKTYARFLEYYHDRFFAQVRAHPEAIWGCGVGEVDSCHDWPRNHFRNKQEAYRLWKKDFFTANYNSGNNIFGDQMAYLRKHGIKLAQANLVMHGSMCFSAHYFFKWGFRGIWMERLSQQGYQIGTAFFRGAAKQHKGLWGIDDASHHPHLNQTTWYDEQGRQRNGYSPSITLRNWLVTFLSGAHLLHQQASELSHFIYDRKGNFRLSPHGENARKFADFCLRKHSDRGRTYVPVALLLNYYHGYDPRIGIDKDRPIVWNGKLPFSREDANITNWLNFFFPGHNLAPGMCENVYNPRAPWRTQWEFVNLMKNGADMRPHEEHSLTPSPYGDSVDVILDDASVATLGQYRIVILAGTQELKAAQVKRLLAFIKNGGTLIASVAQIPREMQTALGIKVTGDHWDYDLTTCLADGQEFGGRRYGYAKVEIQNGKPLGRNHLGDHLVYEVSQGEGQVMLSTIPYGQDYPGTDLMPLCKHVYGRLIDETLIAKAEPATLELITNVGDGFVLVAAFNHGKEPWKGEMRIKKCLLSGKITQVEEIWHGHSVKLEERENEYVLGRELPAFGWEICKLHLRPGSEDRRT